MLTFFVPLLVYILWYPVMLITLFRVEIGILFFISLVPIIAVMKKLIQYPGGHNFADYLLITIVIGWVMSAEKEDRKLFIKSPINRVVILMAVWSFISLIRGYTLTSFPDDVNLERLMTWKNYMILPLLYFIAANNVKSEKFITILIICLSFTLLATDFNFHSTFKWLKSFHYSHNMRISGAFSFLGPNEMGVFYAVSTFLLIGISCFIGNKMLRIWILFVSAVNFYPIVYSYSRAAYMSVLGGILTLGILKDRRFLILPVIIIALYSYILPNSVVERIDSTFLGEEDLTQDILQRSAIEVGDSMLFVPGRKELWDTAIDYFKQHPIMGMGFDTFRHEVGLITHGLFHKILAEQGLMGLFINLIFYGVILRQSYKLFKNARTKLSKGIGFGVFVSIIVHLIGNVSGDQTLYYNLMAIFWFFMGIVAKFNADLVDGTPQQEKLT